MEYNNIIQGVFLKRPNRFIAYCKINDNEEKVHVPNTGRCKEILKEGAKVILTIAPKNSNRKTKYSLISVYKENKLINIDSQSPNAIVEESLIKKQIFKNYNFTTIKREKTYNNSRFDIYYERTEKNKLIKGFIEVKGVTLENNGICSFPDAPTKRGLKHLKELIDAKKNGFEANVLFLIQMNNVKMFTPNYTTDPNFAKTLAFCKKEGVFIHAYSCEVKPNKVTINSPVKIDNLSKFLII